MRFADRDLHLYLHDALEPDAAAMLAEHLAASPALRARLEALNAAGDWPAPGTWRIPPPGLGHCAVIAPSGVLGAERVKAGHVFRLRLASPADAAQREVVVLRRVADDWQVEIPAAPVQRVRLDELPRDGDHYCVDLVVRGPAGPQRWAVGLPDTALLDRIDLADPDWSELRGAITAGGVPISSVDIDVEV